MLFLVPWTLLVLIFPVLLLFLSFIRPVKQPHQLFFEHILQRITRYPKLKRSATEYRLFLFVIMLSIVALSQPVFLSNKSKKQSFTPLVIALDISNSMRKNDIYPNRFSFAKKKIFSLLNKHPHIKASLLLFSREAYLAHPMSEDLDSIRYILSNLPLKFQAGSNLFALFEGAEQILKSYSSKNILLLSDGTSTDDFTKEKIYLKKHNITLNLLSINKEKKNSKLQELCSASGGVFISSTFSEDDISLLLKKILQHKQKYQKSPNTKASQKHQELFYYPLLLALVLLLFLLLKKYEFKRVLFSFLLLYLSNTLLEQEISASILDFKYIRDAKELYEKKEYHKALKAYEKLSPSREKDYNIANTLYKATKYQQAISHYKKALTKKSIFNATIYYNIANAYVHLQKFKKAKQHYIQSLHIQDERVTQENLEALLKFMKRKKAKKSLQREEEQLPKNRSSFVREIPEPLSSNYVIRLKNVVLSEEERWMKEIQKNKPIIFLQKLHTTRMSQNANSDD